MSGKRRKDRSGLWIIAAIAMLPVLLGPSHAAAANDDAARSYTAEDVCALIESNAELRRIPPAFLARLIWQESRFNAGAISPKGAEGIAQFMPQTAAERALDDPFDIPSALAESAAFLAELTAAFGNLGLAAAAYNAGPERVRRWLAGQSGLPLETRHYVRTITGLAAEEWQDGAVDDVNFAFDEDKAFGEACAGLVTAGLPAVPASPIPQAQRDLPWGAQVAAHFSREVAMSAFGRLRQEFDTVLGGHEPMVVQHRAPARGNKPLFAVRIGAETRAAAEAICDDLRAIDGPCMVMKN